MANREEVQPIRVAIADDDPAVVEYLRLALSLEGAEFDVIGIATDGGAAVDLVMEASPDVLVLDLRMPGGGLRTAELLSALSATTRVLVFTADDQGEELLELLHAGIAGYVLKSAGSEELVAAVRTVATGDTVYAPAIAGRAMNELTSRLTVERTDQARLERRRRSIERAISRHAFTMHVQPIVDLATNEVHGMEALSRFVEAPVRGPEEWFTEAAAVGRLVDLEAATARAALALLDQLADHLWLTVNLSPEAVLSGSVSRLFDDDDLDLSRVVVELTEHAAIDDYGFLNAVLARWRERGMRLAVDDAGGGFASFTHVVNARPNLIKLDRQLVAGVDTDDKRQALVRAISAFSREIGADLVAEGVETEAELDVVRSTEVRFGQGYLLGRPMELEQRPELCRVTI